MKHLITALLLLDFYSCKKTETYCGVKDPVKEVSWIQDIINTAPYGVWIYKLTYKTTEGYYIRYCVDSACYVTQATYRACDNTLLYKSSGGIIPGNFPNDFSIQTTYKELIYQK